MRGNGCGIFDRQPLTGSVAALLCTRRFYPAVEGTSSECAKSNVPICDKISSWDFSVFLHGTFFKCTPWRQRAAQSNARENAKETGRQPNSAAPLPQKYVFVLSDEDIRFGTPDDICRRTAAFVHQEQRG
jgi:hypothetical protein